MAADPWAAFPAVNFGDTVGKIGGGEEAFAASAINSPTTAPTPYFNPTPVTGVTSAANAPVFPTGTAIDQLGRLGDEPMISQIQAPALDTNLAMIRGRFSQELQDPDVQNRFFKTINAEVGSQGAQAQQAFVESVFNRAAARGQTLDRTLSGRYWDSRTLAAQNRPLPSDAPNFNPLINNAFSGSNISNYATGNGTGPNVVFKAGGEPFVLEPADSRWATGMSRIAQQAPTPSPVPSQWGTGGTLSLAQAQAALAGQRQPAPAPIVNAINMLMPTQRRF